MLHKFHVGDLARFIGPECAGTASADLPFTVDLDAAAA
jgi:hypothetical protein